MHKTILVASLAVAAAACSPQASEPAATPATAETPATPAPMPDMPMPASPAAGPITSSGKVTAIDAAAGTVTLDHQAIPEVKWDAMTMAFTTTDPAMLKDLKVGDAVSFDLKSAAEPTKISRISKQ